VSDILYGSSERRPGFSEVLERARRRGAVHTSMPAVVVRYDPAHRLVDVQPLIEEAFLDEDDERQTAPFPVCANVPINWPGAGGYVLTFPISDGKTTVVDGAIPPATTGTLFFAEHSLDKWLSGTGGIVDPEIDHVHQMSDGIFVPELRPFGASYPATPADHAVLGKDGGVQIHLRGATICIGDEAGSDFIALATKTMDNINALWNLLNGVFGASSTPLLTTAPGANDAVWTAMKAAIATAVLAGSLPPQAIASAQAKAK
jgi:hypothetical protein